MICVLSACGPGQDRTSSAAEAQVVDLPGTAGGIAFDDLEYSPRLQRVLVPAHASGLYLVEPDSATATRVPGAGRVTSADEGRGLLFLADRDGHTITVVDPADGAVLSSVSTSAPPDYIRYVAVTGELWVTQPAGSPSGIEIFAVPGGSVPTPRQSGFIAVLDGPEGFALSSTTDTAYTHSGTDLVAIDVRERAETSRWPTGCAGTHGFPRIDEHLGVALTGCAADGGVALLDLADGRQLGRYAVGGGAALSAHSDRAGHFYVRSDPGPTIATLRASTSGLTLVQEVDVPETGHCLTADDRGHYWTCDAGRGHILRFDDPGGG
ncbi:YncE family protein [Pseudonocardia sp. H11422]|uniref:YncE family protein n=1 Tax=Pseudonocardia sp. H11422 TaxID=2835866 RepID=UPI001BDC7A1B|nr:hypothetical protein [Pseudonocardia sp. H11422]